MGQLSTRGGGTNPTGCPLATRQQRPTAALSDSIHPTLSPLPDNWNFSSTMNLAQKLHGSLDAFVENGLQGDLVAGQSNRM